MSWRRCDRSPPTTRRPTKSLCHGTRAGYLKSGSRLCPDTTFPQECRWRQWRFSLSAIQHWRSYPRWVMHRWLSAYSPPASSKSQTHDILEMLDNALTGIVAETSSCVVTIEGRRTRTRQQPQSGGDRSPDWHTQGAPMPPNADRNRNSGRPDGRPYNYRNFSTEITGSGFLTEGGYVVTTAEVAEQTIDPMVVMPDGRHIRVAGMNADRQSNIAILRIITQDSVSGLRWGDSEKVRPSLDRGCAEWMRW